MRTLVRALMLFGSSFLAYDNLQAAICPPSRIQSVKRLLHQRDELPPMKQPNHPPRYTPAGKELIESVKKILQSQRSFQKADR
jgi:hypothetical protein